MGWFTKLVKATARSAAKPAARPVKPAPRPRVLVTTGPAIRLAGDGSFGQEVVGESFNQDALNTLCGGKCEEGHELECRAVLTPEPANPYDRNAVMVTVNGHKVAHLGRQDAKRFHAQMMALGAGPGQSAECGAVINGGWIRKTGDEGHYGVELDLSWPLERA